jgi:uncharacterized protein (DUF2132 family)
VNATTVFGMKHVDMRELQSWSPDFGQEVKLGLFLRRTDWDDEQAEALYG